MDEKTPRTWESFSVLTPIGLFTHRVVPLLVLLQVMVPP